MDWLQFVRLCTACRKELPRAIHYILGYGGSLRDSAGLIRHLAGSDKISRISRTTGHSRFVVSKWLKSQVVPSLDTILQMMDEQQFILVEFVTAIVPISKLPSLEPVAARLQEQKQLIYRHPEAEAVLCFLSLATYRALPQHQPGIIAGWLSISLSQEEYLLKQLVAVGLVTEQQGKFEPRSTQIDTQGDFFEAVKIRKFWAKRYERFLELCRPPEGRSKTGYFLIDLSEAGEKQVLEAYSEFCFKLRAIAQKDTGPKKTVKLCNAQILDLVQLGELLRS